MTSLNNSASLSILAYCFSSISMTVVNKYIVSGSGWNLFFFYLAVQVRRIPYFLAQNRPEPDLTPGIVGGLHCSHYIMPAASTGKIGAVRCQ